MLAPKSIVDHLLTKAQIIPTTKSMAKGKVITPDNDSMIAVSTWLWYRLSDEEMHAASGREFSWQT